MKRLEKSYKIILLAIAILFSFNEIKAQCEIHLEDGVTMPVCWNDDILMSVDMNINYSYAWIHKGDTISDGPSALATITENNSVYDVYVWNTASGTPVCNNSITITMRPKFNIAFEQLSLTCSDKSDDNGKQPLREADIHHSHITGTPRFSLSNIWMTLRLLWV